MSNFIAILVPLIRDSNNPSQFNADPVANHDLKKAVADRWQIVGVTPAPNVEGADAAVFYHLRMR